MENFMCGDDFCHDLSDLMELYDIDEETVQELADDWVVNIELMDLERIVTLNVIDLGQMILDNNEDRFPEDGNEYEKIEKALRECVDFEKLNLMMPEVYYPNGKMEKVTKKDIIEFC